MIIEGEEIKITSQKIMPKIQVPEERYTLKGEKVIVFPFSLKIHGNGKILKENNLKDVEGKTIARFDTRALLEKDTCVNGKSLWGFSKNRFSHIEIGTADSRTGGHSCQETKVKDFCYLNLFETYYGVTELIHPEKLYKEAPLHIGN